MTQQPRRALRLVEPVHTEPLAHPGPARLAIRAGLLSRPGATTMKITFTAPKPRNPLVAAALQRQAGAHRRSASAQRQRATMALRRELQHERHPLT